MIKCRLERGKKIKLQVAGSGEDISAESMAFIKMVYEGMYKKNPEVANAYKNSMIASMIDPNSPVFKIPVE